MQWIAALATFVQILAVFMLSVASVPALAQQAIGQRTVVTMTWVEEWDPATQSWVRVGDGVDRRAQARRVDPLPGPVHFATNARHAGPLASSANGHRFHNPLAQYGPFLVIGAERAAMVGSTDSASPQHFEAMLRDFPAVNVLEMVEAPGTSNDIANLEVGRMIRAHNIATHVPNGGSVRSGAVELFLAGAERTMEPGAQFAVHSWLDNYGREPDDFAPDAPANRLYLDYYVEMGMSETRASAFYAMTNSVPHHSAKWLNAWDMEEWISPEVPRIAYVDLEGLALAWSGTSLAQAFLDS